ncbi:MAG: type II toxin-antitoxin system VapC family toxin [Planctomycetes bacterium]|nr:type II toxin-antitoxin system VapC family toxin [Planctomycetota bacterium]
MAWVVDTCLLIDVAEADPKFGVPSAKLLDSKRPQGLTLCPVTYVELAPLFNDDPAGQNEFLFNVGVTWPEAWTEVDTQEAHRAWHRYVAARRAVRIPRRPLADILIGAFASRFDGRLTRNESDFRQVFPGISIVVP